MKFAEVENKLDTFFEIDNGAAESIRSLFNGGIHPDNFKSVQKWLAQCYNLPQYSERFMLALNELIGGFGVEVIRLPGYYNSYSGDIIAEYINTGDTYSPTIVHDLEGNEYEFTTWGDWYEEKIDPRINHHRSIDFWKEFNKAQDENIKYDNTFLVSIDQLLKLCPYFDQPVKYFIGELVEAAESLGIETCHWLYKDNDGGVDTKKSWMFIKR